MSIKDALLELKNTNETFANLVNTGRDVEAAALATATLDKMVKTDSFYTELGIMAAFSSPTDGETLLQTLETVGESNAVIKRMLKWIQPGAIGIDFGNSAVRSMISTLQAANILTTSQANTLLDLGTERVTITENDIAGIR